MGSHRAERRAPRRVSETRRHPTPAGRRIATVAAVQPGPAEPTETLLVGAHDGTAEMPLVRETTPGKRRAVKHAGARGPLFRGLPSPPVLLGVATLAVAVGGVLTSGGVPGAGPQLAHTEVNDVRPASALSGQSGVGAVDQLRGSVSRGTPRDTLGQAAGDDALVAEAEAQAEQRDAAIGALAAQAEKQAAKIKENRWYLPLNPSVTTATFGEYGLWSSYHTGLDFNGETGDSIHAIANGVVTFVGYDGAYGNKTVVTLDDGTELWYCHQTDQYVSVGDVVRGDEVIGTVGTTGNTTGSHLHIEVRPGGGDPVDPYAAFVAHGVTP